MMIEEPKPKEYYEILRRMTGEERMKIAFELSEMTRQIMIAGIKAQNPDMTPEEVEHEAFRRMMLWHKLNSLKRPSKS